MSDTKAGTFLWSHSPPIKIYRPRKRYDPKGVFAFFDNYNVEVRDRVKCVSGSTGTAFTIKILTSASYIKILMGFLSP